MALLKYNMMNLQRLQIPSTQYIEFADPAQIESGKSYTVGIFGWKGLKYEQRCTMPSVFLDHVKELQRIFGKDACIYFYENVPADVEYLFDIKGKGDYSVDTEYKSEEEETMLKLWFDRLSRDYDFAHPISGVISRDSSGRLFISSIT